jgi:ubiquinone/menaquinone biosynthesis C-methylase UbiE
MNEVIPIPDVYATISEQPSEVQERVVEAMSLRANEPEMQAMMEQYLSALDVPPNAGVLEIGCGAGPATRKIAALPGISHVTGLDPSPVFLEKARQDLADLPNVTFLEGDARSLEVKDENFEIVIAHTVLCHVPEPEKVLQEANRVLVSGGQIVVFDGDYAMMSISIGDFDPLQLCVDCLLSKLVHDQWFMRRLPKMITEAGFRICRSDGHGYVKVSNPKYLLTVVDRGADIMEAAGTIGGGLAAELKAEVRRRVGENRFYGEIMFGSLIAEKLH